MECKQGLNPAHMANTCQEEEEMQRVGVRHGKRGKAVEALVNRSSMQQEFRTQIDVLSGSFIQICWNV